MLQSVEKLCVGGGWGGARGQGFLNVHVGIWLLPLKWGEGREREDERKTE